MELEEAYESLGGDLAGVLDRLVERERVVRYLHLYAGSSEADEMASACMAGDWEATFRGAHSLKGMALNLGLDRLAQSASELCEATRHGAPAGDVDHMLDKVMEEHLEVCRVVGSLS